MYKCTKIKQNVCQSLLSFSGTNYSSISSTSEQPCFTPATTRKRGSKAPSTSSSSQGSTIETDQISFKSTESIMPYKDSCWTMSYWNEKIQSYSTSVYLENKGSVARDHLANERTFLAWLRTSLSTISVGIGITQLFRLEKTMTQVDPQPPFLGARWIGTYFILIGIMFLLFAFIRYFHTQVSLTKGVFPASRSTVVLATCIPLLIMILMMVSISSRA